MATRDEIASVLKDGTAARRAGRFGEAFARMTEALGMCGLDQDEERANVVRELGELARNRGDLGAAQAHYEEAVALLRESHNQLKLAHTVRHLGDVHADRRQLLEAQQCYGEALGTYRSHPSPGALDLANAIRACAALKTETGDHEAARVLWAEAVWLYESLGVTAGVDECRRRSRPAT